ncbi:LysM peptidoglycan-binding domain-containing protein [Saprospiraceae bacterium]|jgi:LysM repeat protein|nr:LysM peptidoglycan-binding domain-containing protein [Saprospiraceae bacterium]MDC3209961.1 LysM peptidoglycan-binding domain-containing protein [Saprospiraceae bacterium]
MKFLTTLILLLLSCLIFAHHGDSLTYLTPQDSVFLSVNESNQKIILHQLEKKQTLYSLAKFYGLEFNEVMYYNEELETISDIPVGSFINIPIPNKAIKRYQRNDFNSTKHASIYYKVKKGDTLYGIAKRMLRMPVEDLQKRNNLDGNNISPGKYLHVGWISTEGVPREYRKLKPVPPEWQTSQLNERHYLQAKGIKIEKSESGVAAWNKNSKNEGKLTALHNFAPINSIIEVTNPMNKRSIFVKVIGRPSKNVYYGPNVKVVLTPKVAKMLGARDPRFYVNINFLR